MPKEVKHKVKHIGGHFPTQKQTLLLKAALFDKTEAPGYFEQWLQSHCLAYLKPESDTFLSDFMDTLDLGSQRMLPLVIHNMGENAHPYFKFLSGTRKNYWVRTKQILFHAQKIQKLLEQNGIPSLLIKGLDLATRYYANEAHRPMNDGDVMVPFAYRKKALELILEIPGCTIKDRNYNMRDFVHAIPIHLNGHVDIDLHWNIFHEYAGIQDSTDFIWDTIMEVNTSMGVDRRMQDTHAFFVSLAHGRSFDAVPPFRWVADTLLIYRKSEKLDWDEILTLTRRFHFKPFIKRSVTYLIEEFNMKVPPYFVVQLEEIQAEELEERYYGLISIGMEKGNLVSRMWQSLKSRAVFYRLFLKRNNVSAIRHFVSWYSSRLK